MSIQYLFKYILCLLIDGSLKHWVTPRPLCQTWLMEHWWQPYFSWWDLLFFQSTTTVCLESMEPKPTTSCPLEVVWPGFSRAFAWTYWTYCGCGVSGRDVSGSCAPTEMHSAPRLRSSETRPVSLKLLCCSDINLCFRAVNRKQWKSEDKIMSYITGLL